MELRREMHRAIDLLPEHILQAFYLIAKEHIKEPTDEIAEKRKSLLGCMKGKVWMADNFDEEMDEYGRFASEPDFGKPVKEMWDE